MSDYIKLEYIESNGDAYIDTGFVPNQDTSIKASFYADVVDGATFYYGSGQGYDLNNVELYGDPTANSYELHYNGYYKMATNVQGQWTEFEQLKEVNNVYENCTLIETYSFTYNTFSCPSNSNLVIFALNRNGSVMNTAHPVRCGYFKLYDNGTLIRDFIPVQRKSDGKVGMYDKLNDKFYANGTDSFVAGDIVNTTIREIYSGGSRIDDMGSINGKRVDYVYAGSKLVYGDLEILDYISSDGSGQYINTGVEVSSTLLTDITYQFESYDSNERYVFGLDSPTVLGMISGHFRIYEFGSDRYTGTLDTNKHHTILGTQIIHDGTTIASSITGTDTGKKAYLFCSNTGSGSPNYFSNSRIYECKMYNGSTLVRHFTPVKTPEGEYCLFDSVEQKIYKNAGSGSFTGA